MTNNKNDNKNTNVKAIFEECNFDVDIFEERYGISKELTKNEAQIFNAFCLTTVQFGISNEIVIGTGRSACKTCLFKTNNSLWITWKTDERRGFYEAQLFNNIYEASQWILKNHLKEDNINNAINFFNMLIRQEIPESSLLDFISRMDYTFAKSDTKTFQTQSSDELDKKLSDDYDNFIDSFLKGPQEVNKAFNVLMQTAMKKEAAQASEIKRQKTRK